MKHFAPITKRRTRRGMNEQASAWWTAIEGLDDIRKRIGRVAIEMMDATDFIKQEDTPRTLHYCDPPYYPSSKSVQNTYAHEMTHDQHAELLKVVKSCTGKVILSGYRNELYDEELRDWNRVDINVTNSMAGGDQKGRKIESIWMNYKHSTP